MIFISWTTGFLVVVATFFFGYIACIFIVDLEIDELRPHINKAAIEHGIKAGQDECKKQWLKEEALNEQILKARHVAVKKYLNKLDEIMGE